MPVQQLEIDPVDVIISNPPYFPLEASHPNLQMSPRQLGPCGDQLRFKGSD